jgi:hypothetical protein
VPDDHVLEEKEEEKDDERVKLTKFLSDVG